ncbi:radical SAM protein [Nanoarchaeota archaeon]
MEDFNELLEKANKIYKENHPNTTWFGRCIFLSWFCDVGTCKFCFRSTTKHKIKHAKTARRSISSILTETLIAKNLGWRIEFLTGGYRIFPFEQLVKIAKLVKKIYGEKIWLNLGVLNKEELQQFLPYIKGIVASIETIDKELHDEICPDKAIEPYEDMYKIADELNLKKSMTIVIGLGETKDHFVQLEEFIKKHNLERITFYALKPVKETPFTKSPEIEEYVWWIAKTRISFPKLEIIAGLTPKNQEYVLPLLKAGANAITKFPATKKFNSDKAIYIEDQIKESKRNFKSTLTKLPKINWEEQINQLNSNFDEYKEEMKIKIREYVKKMSK